MRHTGCCLYLLPSSTKLCAVLATDGRSVACETSLHLMLEKERIDNCLCWTYQDPKHTAVTANVPTHSTATVPNTLKECNVLDDPEGSDGLSLHLSDDCNLLHAICKSSFGAFFDASVAFKRRAIRPKILSCLPFRRSLRSLRRDNWSHPNIYDRKPEVESASVEPSRTMKCSGMFE